MTRRKVTLIVVVACLASAGMGFWLGFREALSIGVAAESLPRGVLAMSHLRVLRSGHTDTIVTSLEYDVDRGLVWGHDVLTHPLRTLFVPLWSYDAYPRYEKYAAQLADHRKKHPSPTKSEDYKALMREFEQDQVKYGEVIENARVYQQRLNSMVERYGSKP
jgi:hypothetical protein